MKKIHFMGILGSGCSAAAAIAKAQGYDVSGCDPSGYSEYKDEVTSLAIPVESRHDPSHVVDIDLLVISPAISHYDEKNAEVVAAKQRGITVMTWQQFAGEVLQKDKFVVAVCGTHGKSTTTAMVAQILIDAGLDPTVQLGAIVPGWGKNYHVGSSSYYVIEADEYGNNFLNYHPNLIAVTNIEYDHPEFFATPKSFIQAFRKFGSQIKPGGQILLGPSFASNDQYNIEGAFVAQQHFALQVPGEFNLENASLAAAVASAVGISHDGIEKTLANFTGIGRRFQLVSDINNIKIFDDYGHHPTAIIKTATAARQRYPANVIHLVFQPHMFTRTKAFFHEFVEAFRQAPVDWVYIVDIFPSREHDTGIVSSKDLVHEVGRENVVYGGSIKDVAALLLERLAPADIVINMGAGDIIELSKLLVRNLGKNDGRKI